MSRTILVHSDALDAYSYPPECPFNSQRAGRMVQILRSMGLLKSDGSDLALPEPAPRAILETFHDPHYLDVLQNAARGHMDAEGLYMGLGSPDTPVFRDLYDYATLACGATLTAVELVAAGEARIAFNPSGGYHHAFPARAAGFCYINDVAIACRQLAERYDRVLYLDIDVHHGDGVQAAFYDRRDVLTLSMHESPRTLFPGTGHVTEIGEGPGRGYSVNVPLPPDTYDAVWLEAFRAVAPPIVDAYDPEIIVFEVGMDCLSGDPLAHLGMTNNAYAEAIREAMAFDRPLVVTGGGGYNVENTARGWALAWTVLSGQDLADDLSMGLGGVMLETTDWQAGLMDRRLAVDDDVRARVEPEVKRTVAEVRRLVFPLLGIEA